MRRPNLFSRGNDMDSMMTPMIDVVFLLLVFFVWTASFKVVEYILPTTMSAQLGESNTDTVEPTPEEIDFEQIIIRLADQSGLVTISINESQVASVEELAGRLEVIAGIKIDAPIIIYPDPEVVMEEVIDVYDAAKRTGFEKVSFAVNKK